MVKYREAWRAAVHEVAESDVTGQLNNNNNNVIYPGEYTLYTLKECIFCCFQMEYSLYTM